MEIWNYNFKNDIYVGIFKINCQKRKLVFHVNKYIIKFIASSCVQENQL